MASHLSASFRPRCPIKDNVAAGEREPCSRSLSSVRVNNSATDLDRHFSKNGMSHLQMASTGGEIAGTGNRGSGRLRRLWCGHP